MHKYIDEEYYVKNGKRFYLTSTATLKTGIKFLVLIKYSFVIAHETRPQRITKPYVLFLILEAEEDSNQGVHVNGQPEVKEIPCQNLGFKICDFEDQNSGTLRKSLGALSHNSLDPHIFLKG